MRNFKSYLCFIAMFTLLFSSCSKENEDVLTDDGSKATLSFGAVLNDLVQTKASLKQQMDIPACSEDAPAFVDVVLSGTANVGTMAEPLRVAVNPNPADYDGDGVAEYFTDEHSSLELQAGPYSLDWFVVRNADMDVIWVAPVRGGAMANFVDTPLPMNINLGNGVKKYVDVEVLCFDNREVNQYGYQFFDIETTEAFEFCFFANFCDANGRHFPAAYSVNVWMGQDNTGHLLYSGETNIVGVNQAGDYYASPLCLALPNLDQYADDENYLYYEVTLMDWEGAYGDVTQTVIAGNLSRNDVEANFNGTDRVDYEHLRFGCGDAGDGDGTDGEDGDGTDGDGDGTDGDGDGTDGDGTDGDGDGTDGDGDGTDGDGDGTDGDGDGNGEPVACELEAADAGCFEVYLSGETEDWVLIENPEPDFAGFYALFAPGDEENPYATITSGLVEGDPVFQINTTEEYQLDDYVIYVAQSADDEPICILAEDITPGTGDEPAAGVQIPADLVYPFYARIEANICQ